MLYDLAIRQILRLLGFAGRLEMKLDRDGMIGFQWNSTDFVVLDGESPPEDV